MKYILLSAVVLFLLFYSCKSRTENKTVKKIIREYYADGKIKSETQVKDTSANGLMKNYDREGHLLIVYTYKMSKLEGPAVKYYTNGKPELKMFYRDGKREGIMQWFYDTGELYRVIPYKGGKIDGIKISYYKNGKIMAEAPFLDDYPGIGLIEYNLRGEPIKEDARITIREDDRLFAENKFNLFVSLSIPKPGAKFYLGDLVNGKYTSLSQWQLPEKDGIASYNISLEKGRFRMETLVFTVCYKTSLSNYRVISQEYNLAIDNK